MNALVGKKRIWDRMLLWLPLALICIFTISLALPTINSNINDPNMIVYFNADEGGLMDIIWTYYSGERRASAQWDFDYGLEMRYLADFARLVLSRFMVFTPGTFVLILRWFHLFAWIFSFFVLWRLISRHFGSRWQPTLAVALLAVRPAFAYFSNNLKPEPFVLLIMLIGLDYTLRIVEEPFKRQNLYISIACASVAFLVKYAGIFLLPAIVASMYFANRRQKENYNKTVFPELKISWILPSLIGLLMIILPLLTIIFYIRKSTGFTWYEQFGIWGSLMQNKPILLLWLTGLFFVFLSIVIWIFNRNGNQLVKKIIGCINKINSHLFLVCGIFFGFTLLFGIRWIISPKYFINTYAQLGPAFLYSNQAITVVLAKKGLWDALSYNIIAKIKALDPIIVILFIFYLSMEIYQKRCKLKDDSLNLLKRYVLLIFLIPLFILIFSMGRIGQHHMLPFFVAISILAIQGVSIFNYIFNIQRIFKTTIIIFISMLFALDIFTNGIDLVKRRLYRFRQHEDLAFKIAEWWPKNISKDAKIVSEHYICVYVPSGYKNLKTCPWNPQDRVANLRNLVNIHHPQFVYYNEGPAGEDESIPPIEKILPDKRVRLIKSFNSAGRRYQRRLNDKFFIYEILYK